MSYDEHLISMAGGDGEPDLDAIQARSDVANDYPGAVTIEQSQTDVPALLALVRDQAAKLGRVEALHRGNRWGFCEACSEHVDIPMPCPTRAAITATEAAETFADRMARKSIEAKKAKHEVRP